MSNTAFQVKNGLIVNNGIFTVDPAQNAAIVANTLFVGNNSVNSAIFANGFFSGVANTALSISGISAANIVSNTQLQSNLALYQTDAGMVSNVQTIQSLQLQTLTQNNAGANVTTWTPTNATSTMAFIQLKSNTTFGVPTGFANGTYLLFVQQANGGNNHAAWFANNFFWPAGVAPQLSTANAAIDILSFIFNSGMNQSGNLTLFGTYAPNFLG